MGDSLTIVEPERSELPTDDNHEEGIVIDSDTGEITIVNGDSIDPESGQLIYENPLKDTLINAEVLLPLEDEIVPGKVLRRSKPDGKTIGNYNVNPSNEQHYI